MLLPDNPETNQHLPERGAIVAKLEEVLAELDALDWHLAAAHVSMAIEAVSKSGKD